MPALAARAWGAYPRRMIRALRLLAFMLICAAPVPAAAQPPVWIVHGPHATIVLFGSVHLLPPNLDWEPPQLSRAIEQADDLWFEIPIDPGASLSAAQLAARRGFLPPGVSLSQELDAGAQAKLARAAQSCGLPLDTINRLRPWYAELALSVASYRQYGAGVESGVEQRLSAANPKVPRRAFETVAQQIEFLSGSSDADQLASLVETLGEIEEGPAVYQRLVGAWMSGDTAAIEREALDPLIKQAPGVYRALVADRNRRWIPLIRDRLAGRGQAVMVVGVGHLIGPDSVPALLRRQGVKVDGP